MNIHEFYPSHHKSKWKPRQEWHEMKQSQVRWKRWEKQVKWTCFVVKHQEKPPYVEISNIKGKINVNITTIEEFNHILHQFCRKYESRTMTCIHSKRQRLKKFDEIENLQNKKSDVIYPSAKNNTIHFFVVIDLTSLIHTNIDWMGRGKKSIWIKQCLNQSGSILNQHLDIRTISITQIIFFHTERIIFHRFVHWLDDCV